MEHTLKVAREAQSAPVCLMDCEMACRGFLITDQGVNAEGKGLSLPVIVAPDVPQIIKGDEGKVRQICDSSSYTTPLNAQSVVLRLT